MNILVVAHDAGGAQIISSWVKSNKDNNYSFILKGPAKAIFERDLHDISDVIEIARLDLTSYDLMLTGSGWASHLELDHIQYAKKHGLKTATYLDHWVNYKERFGYPKPDWRDNLPDELWCGDESSLEIAKELDVACRLMPNQYFCEFAKNVRNSRCGDHENGFEYDALYISEPTSEHMMKRFQDPMYKGFNEFSLLDDLLKKVCETNNYKSLLIRLHPADDIEKYNDIIACHSAVSIDISRDHSLEDDIARSRDVYGGESMALALAAQVKDCVYSLIARNIAICPLPLKNIKQIF